MSICTSATVFSKLSPVYGSVSGVFRSVRVIVVSVTPGAVAPPLLPVNAATHGGAYGVHVTCSTPAPHSTPLLAVPESDPWTTPAGPAVSPPADPPAVEPPGPTDAAAAAPSPPAVPAAGPAPVPVPVPAAFGPERV